MKKILVGGPPGAALPHPRLQRSHPAAATAGAAGGRQAMLLCTCQGEPSIILPPILLPPLLMPRVGIQPLPSFVPKGKFSPYT